MFDVTSWHKDLYRNLINRGEDVSAIAGRQALLFRVELGLRLLERLAERIHFLDEEPTTVLWVILTGLPLPDVRLQAIAEDDWARRMVAAARLLLPYSGRFSWESALRQYAQIPEEWRCYHISADDLEQQLIAGIRIEGQRLEHIDAYDTLLHTPLPPRFSERSRAESGAARFRTVARAGGEHELHVDLRDDVVQRATALAPASPPFLHLPRERRPYQIPWSALERTAEELDGRLAEQNQPVEWVYRFQNFLHYSALADGKLVASDALNINGFSHVVGMVGSGKSTLMKLIAADAVLHHRGERHVTLVLGDGMAVLDAAEELNRLLAQSGKPVAVPVLGHTSRDTHLNRFYNSGLDPRTHWSPRWLDTACPLLGLVPLEQIADLPSMPVSGWEPCERLDTASPTARNPHYKYCPFFYGCPSQRTYRDMVDAQIWITTPGGMASSAVPLQIDPRRLKLGELIYLHSDVVILDEVDTVMSWFDDEYASEVRLRGGANAIFDSADRAAAEALRARLLPAHEERWVRAERRTTEAISNILTQLSDATLRRWIGGKYFTAFNLFNRLARALSGVPDWPADGDWELDDVSRARADALLQHFDALTEGDPIALDQLSSRNSGAVEQLIALMKDASIHGANNIVSGCDRWIRTYVPDFGIRIDEFNQRQAPHSGSESLSTLAYKLAFALSVALLDRNLRIALYEWYNQPNEAIQELGYQPYRRSTSALTDVLPIPPTGRIFGTYYAHDPEEADRSRSETNALSRLEYTNIGRWYILHYHELLSDLGWPGPHVLAMSGSSWLPDSTRWHVDVEPQGVLEANEDHTEAIAESTFAFLPQYSERGEPIIISGERDKIAALRNVAYSLLRTSHLIDELDCLGELEEAEQQTVLSLSREDAEHYQWRWADRSRLLLLTNSYDQAEELAQALSRGWSRDRDIYFLQRADDEREDALAYFAAGTLQRSDIENFAGTGGRILVAPTKAIARGYNILNEQRVAAFGAVYLLIRPMPHPFDVQALTAELNHRTLQWCRDEHHPAWQYASLVDKGIAFRRHAKEYWRRAEMRRGYDSFEQSHDHSASPRADWAASVLGETIQAAGRLMRGGVPFHAYFIDAKWAPKSAVWRENDDPVDTPATSLLAEMVRVFRRYVDESIIGERLYLPFEGLLEIENFHADISEEDK